MPPRTAFTQSDLDDHGRLTVRGVSELLPDAELVFRHIAFEQGGACVHAAPTDAAKGWSAVLDAPTFVAGDAFAIGSETYLITHDSFPVFTTFTWSESLVIRQT
jgi:hypothetical protein